MIPRPPLHPGAGGRRPARPGSGDSLTPTSRTRSAHAATFGACVTRTTVWCSSSTARRRRPRTASEMYGSSAARLRRRCLQETGRHGTDDHRDSGADPLAAHLADPRRMTVSQRPRLPTRAAAPDGWPGFVHNRNCSGAADRSQGPNRAHRTGTSGRHLCRPGGSLQQRPNRQRLAWPGLRLSLSVARRDSSHARPWRRPCRSPVSGGGACLPAAVVSPCLGRIPVPAARR